MGSTTQKITREQAEAIVDSMTYEEVLFMINLFEKQKHRED